MLLDIQARSGNALLNKGECSRTGAYSAAVGQSQRGFLHYQESRLDPSVASDPPAHPHCQLAVLVSLVQFWQQSSKDGCDIKPPPATTYSTSLPQGRHAHPPEVLKLHGSLHHYTSVGPASVQPAQPHWAASYTKACAHPACTFPQALHHNQNPLACSLRTPTGHHHTQTPMGTQLAHPCRTYSNQTDTCRRAACAAPL